MNADELYNILTELGISGIVQRGNNWQACCPNPDHSERRPSWAISFNEPHPHGCFGCGYTGTLLTLLMRVGRWSHERASKLLRLSETSKPLVSLSSDDVLFWQPKVREGDLIDRIQLYPYQLTKRARKYLKGRGVSLRTMQKAEVAYHPEFKRVLFPWYDSRRLIGCTGRYIGKGEHAKTLPLFESPKGHAFYLPTRKIRRGLLILVEGEIDALKVHTAGFPNVGALCHGVLTKRQIKLLEKSAAEEVMAFFDDDKAGNRLGEQLQEALTGKKSLSRVEWKTFRSEERPKLDPAILSAGEIRKAVRSRAKNSDMEWL